MSKVLNLKKVLSTTTPSLDVNKKLKEDVSNGSHTGRTILIASVIIIIISVLIVGGYYLVKYFMHKDDIVPESSTSTDNDNSTQTDTASPKRLLSFKLRGTSGQEKFKITSTSKSSDATNTVTNPVITIMDETVLPNTFVTYVKEVPYDQNEITFTFLNDDGTRDIIVDNFMADNIDILPKLRVRSGMDQARIDKYRSGLFLWSGDYIFDL